jgi:hypothetical protein
LDVDVFFWMWICFFGCGCFFLDVDVFFAAWMWDFGRGCGILGVMWDFGRDVGFGRVGAWRESWESGERSGVPVTCCFWDRFG